MFTNPIPSFISSVNIFFKHTAMAFDNPESFDPSEEFHKDRTEYMIRRDKLLQEGYKLSFSYSREMATELREQLVNTRNQLRKNGFMVVTVICDQQTALYYKHD